MSLLRKTRFQSLFEGDAKKLSMFMLAELVLITLGMSIALQFDQWKEYQGKLDKEIVLLEQLQIEFVKAESMIVFAINELDSLDAPRFKLYKNCGNNQDELTEFELLELNVATFTFMTLTISNGVLHDAINSGKFTLIQNEKLRTQLSDWEGRVKRMEYRILKVNERIANYYTDSFNYLSYRDIDHKSYPDLDLQNSVLSHNELDILYSLRFENHIGDVFFQGRAMKNLLSSYLMEPVKEILNILEKEIELKSL
ncbi:MAG: hypothetical protein HOM41_07755 [Flavobacteriales bacterium]|mgnify:CR=1 FL=1|jgi:hypothetical protein|nr:hypothetical protein [Flavobacteriales bacterium]MBT6174656.1 hypothetical protein [Flavobacteriales bacterium]